jgi:hypothetical protein
MYQDSKWNLHVHHCHMHNLIVNAGVPDVYVTKIKYKVSINCSTYTFPIDIHNSLLRKTNVKDFTDDVAASDFLKNNRRIKSPVLILAEARVLVPTLGLLQS